MRQGLVYTPSDLDLIFNFLSSQIPYMHFLSELQFRCVDHLQSIIRVFAIQVLLYISSAQNTFFQEPHAFCSIFFIFLLFPLDHDMMYLIMFKIGSTLFPYSSIFSRISLYLFNNNRHGCSSEDWDNIQPRLQWRVILASQTIVLSDSRQD